MRSTMSIYVTYFLRSDWHLDEEGLDNRVLRCAVAAESSCEINGAKCSNSISQCLKNPEPSLCSVLPKQFPATEIATANILHEFPTSIIEGKPYIQKNGYYTVTTVADPLNRAWSSPGLFWVFFLEYFYGFLLQLLPLKKYMYWKFILTKPKYIATFIVFSIEGWGSSHQTWLLVNNFKWISSQCVVYTVAEVKTFLPDRNSLLLCKIFRVGWH